MHPIRMPVRELIHMKRIHSALAAVVVAAAVIAPGASAATIYEHINYGGAARGNDEISSWYAS